MPQLRSTDFLRNQKKKRCGANVIYEITDAQKRITSIDVPPLNQPGSVIHYTCCLLGESFSPWLSRLRHAKTQTRLYESTCWSKTSLGTHVKNTLSHVSTQNICFCGCWIVLTVMTETNLNENSLYPTYSYMKRIYVIFQKYTYNVIYDD